MIRDALTPSQPPHHFGVVAPAFPSHFSAMAALAAELVRRGHRVTFLQRPDARAFLGDALPHGLGFHALGAQRFPPGSLAAALRRAANPGSPLGLRKVIVDMADATDMLCQQLPAAIAALQIDVLIGDQMEAAAGLVAEALQMPLVSVACALPVNREPAVPLPVMPFGFDASARGLQMVAGSTGVYDWLMAPHRRAIERQSRRLGLPVRGALHECLSPLAQISQTIAGFDFPRQHLPAHFHHVGPLRPAADAAAATVTTGPLPALAADRPLVFASLGTLQGQRFGTFHRIARACRALDVQLVLAHCGGLDARQAQAIEQAGPPGATTVCAFAPQQAVLARADAVVTHAGLNTVMDAIATGTPMLALPIAFDQPGAAARICHAGIGRRASARTSSPRTLAAHLRQLLDDPAYGRRLAPLAAELAQAGGTVRAADIVEAATARAESMSP
ncbi:MAG: glycosyltransferase [Duganella sp.]